MLLREVLYRVSRSVDDGAMVRPSEAIGPLEGTIDVGDMAETVVLSGVDDLVLQLEDGQRVAIALTSTHGRFQLRGVGPGPDGLRDFAMPLCRGVVQPRCRRRRGILHPRRFAAGERRCPRGRAGRDRWPWRKNS